nr:FAD-dependent oxidoreductase [Desulfobacteraceae bacterium]
AALPPGREEFAQLAMDLATQVAKRGIRIHLSTTVDAALLDREKPDAVILATGAKPVIPPIPGVNLPHVVQAWDVLADRVSTGTNVVVIGGGAVGVETALFLSEKGTISGDALKFLLVSRAESYETLYDLATRGSKNVVIVEMLDKVGAGIGKSTKWVMLQEMDRNKIATRVGARALEITENHVTIAMGDTVEELPADSVVLATGARSVNELAALLKEKNIPFVSAGDANQIALAFDAVHQGHEAGRLI